MGNDQDHGDAFAAKACELIKENAARIRNVKAELSAFADKQYLESSGTLQRYLDKRWEYEKQSFEAFSPIYKDLIRKSSQWLQHGRIPSPELRLELEIRLADFEKLLSDCNVFFASLDRSVIQY